MLWQDSKCYVTCKGILGPVSGMFRHIYALFKSILEHIENLRYPWHILITKHIQILRYIHNAILNIFTKAQSWTFDAVLNAPLFYRCYLALRVALVIFNVIFQTYSRLIQPYLVLLKNLRYIKSPDIFRDILLQPCSAIF